MLKGLAAVLLAARLWAAEPIEGQWRLKSQQVNGRETSSPPLVLRITKAGDRMEFTYSTSGDQQLRFSAKLDGSPTEIEGSGGKKMGFARLTRGGSSEYRVMLEGPNRPTSNGRLTVSNGGKTLTSESDAAAPHGDKLHTVQVFERK